MTREVMSRSVSSAVVYAGKARCQHTGGEVSILVMGRTDGHQCRGAGRPARGLNDCLAFCLYPMEGAPASQSGEGCVLAKEGAPELKSW